MLWKEKERHVVRAEGFYTASRQFSVGDLPSASARQSFALQPCVGLELWQYGFQARAREWAEGFACLDGRLRCTPRINHRHARLVIVASVAGDDR
jgi:hypothetical protein